MRINWLIVLLIFLFTFPVFTQEPEKKEEKVSEIKPKIEPVSKSKTVDDLRTQIKTFKNKRGFEVNYDRFDESTLVGFDGFELLGFGETVGKIMSAGTKAEDTPSLMMKLYFGFNSSAFNKNIEKFVLVFTSTDTEWRFQKNRELFAIADGERFKFGEGRLASSDVRFGKGRGVAIYEGVSFVLTREELAKFGQAKSLEIRIGKREQTLKDKHKLMFRDLLSLGTVSDIEAAKEK